MKKKILVLHGPNLNLLGTREPEIYGKMTLDDLNQQLKEAVVKGGCEFEAYQSNAENQIIEKVSGTDAGFIVINPAAFTHTSVAIRDALAGVKIPFIEVHISNVHAREEFRKKSYFSDIALGVICGLGKDSYTLAVSFAIKYLHESR